MSDPPSLEVTISLFTGTMSIVGIHVLAACAHYDQKGKEERREEKESLYHSRT